MKGTQTYLGVTKKDIQIIEMIVEKFSTTLDQFEVLQYLRHAIGKRIKSEHFLVFGYLIGEKVATENATKNLNLNNFQLCQRQN